METSGEVLQELVLVKNLQNEGSEATGAAWAEQESWTGSEESLLGPVSGHSRSGKVTWGSYRVELARPQPHFTSRSVEGR